MNVSRPNWKYRQIDEEYISRGGIETHTQFVERNILWWKNNRGHEAKSRKPYYNQFLDLCGIRQQLKTSYGYSIAEVGPGPFGGMLEVCNVHCCKKVFIDPILDNLVELGFIQWPVDAQYIVAPAESIPLGNNAVDILVSYNCIDHGWDIVKAILECVRISKRCYLCFDCRGDNKEEVKKRKEMNDLDHYQHVKYSDIWNLCHEHTILREFIVRMIDIKTRDNWPVAFVQFSKDTI